MSLATKNRFLNWTNKNGLVPKLLVSNFQNLKLKSALVSLNFEYSVNYSLHIFLKSNSAQTAPDYNICLLPEFWRFRHGEHWENHFVTVAKIILGKVVHAYVPILPAEYRSNPTLWPRGNIGTCFNLKFL